MRSRINAVVILAAAFIVFTAVSSAKGVQTSSHQLQTAVVADGPMCPPTSGCGDRVGVFASGRHFPAAVLSADGGGPMCIPHTACGYKDGMLGMGLHFPKAALLTDGGGPMCIPGSACESQAVYALGKLSYRLLVE